MNTNLGLSTSPTSGSVVNRSASTHIRKVENITGRAACAPSSSRLMMPRPWGSVRSRSSGSSSGSPKNKSAPSASRLTRARRMTPCRRGRHRTQRLEFGLALVTGEELDHRTQILDVQQGQTLLVGPVEDQTQGGLLSVVEPQHLREQNRPEAGDRGPYGHTDTVGAQREELHRKRGRRPGVAGVLGALIDLLRSRCPEPRGRTDHPSRRPSPPGRLPLRAARRSPEGSWSCRYR